MIKNESTKHEVALKDLQELHQVAGGAWESEMRKEVEKPDPIFFGERARSSERSGSITT